MYRTILAAGAAAIALATAAPAPVLAQEATLSAPEIAFTEWTLDNGLRVIALPDDSTGQVTTEPMKAPRTASSTASMSPG